MLSLVPEVLLLRLYPDIARVADARLRRRVWREAAKRCRRSPLLLFMLVVILSGSVYGALFGVSRDFVVSPGWRPLFRVLVTFYVGWLLLGVLYPLVARRRMRRLLWEHLAKEGFAICAECGYDLRGQTSSVCPECGRPREPSAGRHQQLIGDPG